MKNDGNEKLKEDGLTIIDPMEDKLSNSVHNILVEQCKLAGRDEKIIKFDYKTMGEN